jgi:C1A family cysteine protease
MNHKIARYGWNPDLPDHRDHLFAAAPPILSALPPSADLRGGCPPVYNQGQLGSCTANAIAAAIEFDEMKEKLADAFEPSRLFIYYNERVIEGTVSSDSGAQIRDGVKSVATIGYCPETPDWPYDPADFAKTPPKKAFTDAAKHKIVSYQRVARELNQMKGCLAAGYPFVFGFSVYESFESPAVGQSGHCPMPSPNESMIGGHAVVAVGYDDANSWFVVRNSWGAEWGMAGYFTLPYAYLTQRGLASDFWTIRAV